MNTRTTIPMSELMPTTSVAAVMAVFYTGLKAEDQPRGVFGGTDEDFANGVRISWMFRGSERMCGSLSLRLSV